MQNHIRAHRKAKGLTLTELADRCDPPTTAQTIGRLEMGMRTLSLDWLDRIAAALKVPPEQLVGKREGKSEAMFTAALGKNNAQPLAAPTIAHLPIFGPHVRLMQSAHTAGDFQAGDLLWLEDIAPNHLPDYLGQNLLLPGRAGDFHFGRLAAWDGQNATLLPPDSKQAPLHVAAPQWAANLVHLIRNYP